MVITVFTQRNEYFDLRPSSPLVCNVNLVQSVIEKHFDSDENDI